MARSMSLWKQRASTQPDSYPNLTPHQIHIFPPLFGSSLRFVGFALHLVKESGLHIRVGLVLWPWSMRKQRSRSAHPQGPAECQKHSPASPWTVPLICDLKAFWVWREGRMIFLIWNDKLRIRVSKKINNNIKISRNEMARVTSLPHVNHGSGGVLPEWTEAG